MSSGPRIDGAILAGGRSARMGGGHKALLPLAGRPLIRHVIDRAAPQVDRLMLSVERTDEAWDSLGLPQVPDPQPGHRGPLGGLLAALEAAAGHAEWLMLLPCDAPFLPRHLAARLLEAATAARSDGAVVRYRGVLQPTFSLWNRCLASRLRTAVERESMGGFMVFLDTCPMATLDENPGASSGPPPFFNVNTPSDLQRAETWLSGRLAEAVAC